MDWLAYEELEAEWNARYDYVAEAYGATARDCNDMAEDDARIEWAEAWANVCDEMEAWGRPCLKTFDGDIPF